MSDNSFEYVPEKDPKSVEPYFFVFCSPDGTNDGSLADDGELQGATITSATVTPESGLTLDSKNRDAVTIGSVSYSAGTVVSAWYSGGEDGEEYEVECVAVLSDSRTLVKTMIVPVEEG